MIDLMELVFMGKMSIEVTGKDGIANVAIKTKDGAAFSFGGKTEAMSDLFFKAAQKIGMTAQPTEKKE